MAQMIFSLTTPFSSPSSKFLCNKIVSQTHHSSPQLCGDTHKWPSISKLHMNTCLATPKLKLSSRSRSRASVDDVANDTSSSSSSTPLLQQQQYYPNQEVEESIKLLKKAAKTRKVDKSEILTAFSVIEKAKLDPSNFLETLGGTKSPGKTWMLIFTAEKSLKGGRYFPITAVQRFDAEGKRIENGVYLGPLGSLSFEGRFSWKKRILAFVFECVRIKVGPFNPLQLNLGNQDDREPNNKDPFFIWFYIDEEIAVARGRSGGTAFWCRCSRVSSP